MTRRSATTAFLLALGVSIPVTAMPALAQEAQAVRDALGRAQSGAERRAVEDLINRLRGTTAQMPLTTAGPPAPQQQAQSPQAGPATPGGPAQVAVQPPSPTVPVAQTQTASVAPRPPAVPVPAPTSAPAQVASVAGPSTAAPASSAGTPSAGLVNPPANGATNIPVAAARVGSVPAAGRTIAAPLSASGPAAGPTTVAVTTALPTLREARAVGQPVGTTQIATPIEATRIAQRPPVPEICVDGPDLPRRTGALSSRPFGSVRPGGAG